MKGYRIWMVLALAWATAFADDDFKVLVRGGCPEEIGCCSFGNWRTISGAPVFETTFSPKTIGRLKKNQVVVTLGGQVEATPGRVQVLHDRGEWKKGQVLALYTDPMSETKMRVGTHGKLESLGASFLLGKEKCATPSEECWGRVKTMPKQKWLVNVKLSEKRMGWVEGKHFDRATICEGVSAAGPATK